MAIRSGRCIAVFAHARLSLSLSLSLSPSRALSLFLTYFRTGKPSASPRRHRRYFAAAEGRRPRLEGLSCVQSGGTSHGPGAAREGAGTSTSSCAGAATLYLIECSDIES